MFAKNYVLASLTKYSFLDWNIYRIFYITRQMDYSENLTGTCYLESPRRQVLITVTKMADVTLHFQNQSQISLAFSFKCFLDRYVQSAFYLALKINPMSLSASIFIF